MELTSAEGSWNESKPSQSYSRNDCLQLGMWAGGSISFLGLLYKIT